MRKILLTGLLIALPMAAATAWSWPDPADADGLRAGAPAIASLGAMTFGPDGILFVGDSEGAAIHAIRIEDGAVPSDAPIAIEGIDRRIAQALGTTADDIVLHDMAVHPVSRNVYVTVTRGRGAGGSAVLLRITRDADRPIEEVSLADVRFSTAAIPNAPASDPEARRNPRTYTVTDLAYEDGNVFIAGLSNEEFTSAFRQLPFPFGDAMETTTLEIYHVSHGRNETNAPVMTFLPKRIDGSLFVLAAYTCTPLVAFPMDDLKNGDHVFGRTVAELGAGNQPLDMIAYEQDGQERILIANSRHPLMRVDPSDIAGAPALVSPTEEPGIARIATSQTGIRQLADLNDGWVVVIQAAEDGSLDLRSLEKSTL